MTVSKKRDKKNLQPRHFWIRLPLNSATLRIVKIQDDDDDDDGIVYSGGDDDDDGSGDVVVAAVEREEEEEEDEEEQEEVVVNRGKPKPYGGVFGVRPVYYYVISKALALNKAEDDIKLELTKNCSSIFQGNFTSNCAMTTTKIKQKNIISPNFMEPYQKFEIHWIKETYLRMREKGGAVRGGVRCVVVGRWGRGRNEAGCGGDVRCREVWRWGDGESKRREGGERCEMRGGVEVGRGRKEGR
ncbi:hypothetical protein PoB_004093600 [Plakobranchus ocellatus]|uniref:Uncharacterized protein n=1 Tax=Plakobranchus ocellatus TaxID=259542 RepID=A0AAV4B6K5_9GAST|nr:hypothetical protein PoB_004093600 [Plakobranchus ocellatus]